MADPMDYQIYGTSSGMAVTDPPPDPPPPRPQKPSSPSPPQLQPTRQLPAPPEIPKNHGQEMVSFRLMVFCFQKVLKFEAEGREFAKFLSLLVQFI